MSETVWSRMPGQEETFHAATGGRFRDVVGIVAHTGTGTGVALNGPLAGPRAMSAVVSGCMRTRPLASARRAVTSFLVTSTMRAGPSGSRWGRG